MDPAQDALFQLQDWFAATADGEWEHQQGIAINTLDNPGWSLKVELAQTALANRQFDRVEEHRGHDDWIVAWREHNSFHAACGPRNLSEAISTFLAWATP